jgi:quercetin dioxygenase-like cupin family protein
MKSRLSIVIKSLPRAVMLLVGITGVGVAGNAILAAATGPTEHKDIKVGKLEELPESTLKATIGLEGYTLRMRWVTIEPGGHIAEHSHADRPGIVSMIDGNWVEGKPEGEDTYSAEDYGTFPEHEDTVHWIYNRTETPATALVCDIAKSG